MCDQAAPQLYGVCVTFRRPDELGRSLRALAEQTHRLDHLVVVDNHPDGSVSLVLERWPGAATEFTLLESAENIGPAGGIADGMERVLCTASDQDFIVVLDDDDPLIDRQVLADLLAAASQRDGPELGGIGLRGARLDRRRGRLHPPSRSELQRRGHAGVDYLKSGWAPLYKVQAIREVGAFERDLFFGFDDVEFGLRLKRAGKRVEVHVLGRPQPPEPARPSWRFQRSAWRTYYTQRNLLILIRRYASRRALVELLAVQGVVKPVANLAVSGRGAMPQVRMAFMAVRDGLAERTGRPIDPTASKSTG